MVTRFTKHVGRHNNKRVIIVYREVPEESHMALVVYTETLSSLFSDTIAKAVESDAGQNTDNVADVIFRSVLPDGRNALEALHREGLLKKVPTSQIIVTPNTNSAIRLDELNTMLRQMAEGEEAVKRMAEIDSQRGMAVDQRRFNSKNVENLTESVNPNNTLNTYEAGQLGAADILSDEQIAKQRIAQATKMKMEAQQLLAEAKRLEEEANALSGVTLSEPVSATTGGDTNVEQDSKPTRRTRKVKAAQEQ